MVVGDNYEAACALDEDGEVYCWGRDFDGSPMHEWCGLPGGPYQQVVVNGAAFCVMDADNMVHCKYNSSFASFQTKPDVAFADIDCGYTVCCGATLEGDAECWGGDYTDLENPLFLHDENLPDAHYTRVVAGLDFICGLTTEGKIHCVDRDGSDEHEFAGRNYVGLDSSFYSALGVTGDGKLVQTGFVNLPESEHDIVAVEGGYFRVCILDEAGEVHCACSLGGTDHLCEVP